MTNKHP